MKMLITFLLATLAPLGHASTKIDAGLKAAFSRAPRADVIVYLKQKADLRRAPDILDRTERIRFVYDQLRSTADRSQRRLLARLASSGVNAKTFYIENAIAISSADAALVKKLSLRREVERIGLNAAARLVLPPVQAIKLPSYDPGIASHLEAIGVDRVWSELGVTGNGIVMAGQDSGVYWEHEALKTRYRGFQNGAVDHNYNWHDAVRGQPTPSDDTGHGTHTMGTMVGDGGRAHRIGAAPGAKWIACKNMNQGVGTLASYLECFEFFLAPYPAGGDPRTDGRPELAPHVVNNSWACPAKEGCSKDDLLGSIRTLTSAGIMVVAVAGNEGPDCGSVSTVPGHFAGELISVGAYNRYTHDAAFFSSRGPSAWNGGMAPMIMAPGEIINSSMSSGPSAYDDKSGTSMASPQVAGVVALLWSAHPELIGQIQRTYEIIQQSATPLTTGESCGGISGRTIPNATFGYGMINAFAALTHPSLTTASYLIKLKRQVAQSRVALWRTQVAGPIKPIRADVMEVKLTPVQAERLSRTEGVLLVERNRRLKLLQAPNDLTSEQWALANPSGFDMGAIAGWSVTTGSKSVVVAVVDSGIDLGHWDLRDNLWVNEAEATGRADYDDDGNGFTDDIHGYNFAFENGDPSDLRGHGSHVAGIIGAKGNNGYGVVGMNWDVSLMALNMFPRYLEAQMSDGIRAIDYAIANGARVINASFGQADADTKGSDYRLLLEAMMRARDAGVVVVAAAGNDGQDDDVVEMIPATFGLDNIIAVGAMNRYGELWPKSNYGATRVDVIAPGVEILSTVPGGTQFLNGTSMAAPHVTGVVALMLSVNPDLKPAEVKEILVRSCTPNAALIRRSRCQGHLNAGLALQTAIAMKARR